MIPPTRANNLIFLSPKEKPLSGQYTSLPTEESSKTHLAELDTESDQLTDDDSLIHSPKRKLQKVQTATIALLILLCGILTTLLLKTHHVATDLHHCGTTNTTAEARALGCEFDILGNSWTPKQCFDNETAIEFREWLQHSERQMGTFPFFHDEDGKERIMDEDELAESVESRVYTTQEHHLAHCTFLMRRIYRVGHSNGRMRLNSRYGTLEHTKHCTNEVLLSFRRPDPKHMGGIHAGFHITFEHC